MRMSHSDPILTTKHTQTPSTRQSRSHQVHRPQIAIIVVNWNRCDDTLACLASLYRMLQQGEQDYAGQILLVDNGSTDGTPDRVRSQFPETEVLTLPHNLGFATGCNVGLRHALAQSADYILLVNNDTVVAPDMLSHLLAVATSRPDVGLLSPVIYYFDEPERIWCAGFRQRPITLSAQPPTTPPTAGTPYLVDRLYGCGLLIRRQVLEWVGLFDERFFMYYEDADLCRRVQAAGFNLMVVPAAKMWHKVSASSGEGSPLQKYYLARSSVLFFAQHTPYPLWPLLITYRLGVALKQILLCIWQRRWPIIPAYLRGLADGLHQLRHQPDPILK